LIRRGGGAINGAMRKLLLVVGLAGCWTSSSAPASKPKPVEGDASTGGATYAGMAALLGTSLSSSGWGDPNGGLSGHIDPGFASGVSGTGTGSGTGTSGLGTVGVGGGGTGTGTSGGGQTGAIGHGTGYGPGGRVGSSSSGSGGSGGGSAVPTVSIGDPTGPSQALDPAIIRRLIRRNINKIQYCYEQELVAQPGLEGRVNVRFSIGADGKVTQSTGSGMPPVDACVAGVIAAIEFPRPTGGGVVMVNYPFIFKEPKLPADPAAP
jgi:hypothetical protein